ncbi:YfhD family protein [Bacillus anthracis]|nr:YfhD family protein [Bacillus anthracis]PTR55530.1 YfhD family protein [Bacillus anthracis]PTR64758.1 YfhD family protein [Bacillus anthracis]PTR70704.1 YfhD family protein [Bacillus anthracis]PTR81554.1 YfhD family protein [Bacillus anthracis]
MQRRIKRKEIVSNEQKNFKQNKATDGIDVEFSRELADHNDLEANARANAADARQKRQSTEK